MRDATSASAACFVSRLAYRANQNPDDAYNLLRDESVQPMSKEKIKAEQITLRPIFNSSI